MHQAPKLKIQFQTAKSFIQKLAKLPEDTLIACDFNLGSNRKAIYDIPNHSEEEIEKRLAFAAKIESFSQTGATPHTDLPWHLAEEKAALQAEQIKRQQGINGDGI